MKKYLHFLQVRSVLKKTMLNTHTCMIRMTLVDPRGLAGKRTLPLQVLN